MKIDGRTKFGKQVNQTKKEVGLIAKILKIFWLFFYLPYKYLFLGIRFIIKNLIVAIKLLIKNLMVASKYLASKLRNND